MSLLHHLVTLPIRPITTDAYIPELIRLLKSGIPATYTLEQVAAYEKGDRDGPNNLDSNTTPLHILCKSLPSAGELGDTEKTVVLMIMDKLFEFGAGWNFLDYEGKHIGDLLLEKGYGAGDILYDRVIEAGVSAELLLRKINGGDIEFIEEEGVVGDDTNCQQASAPQHSDSSMTTENDENEEPTYIEAEHGDNDATAADQVTYLKTELEYTEDSLVTKQNRDGVMMAWESEIMKIAAASLVVNRDPNQECNILNIGFGMGIIDSFIQSHKPTRHYICEAHPDVLAKMKRDGWYEKPGVVILEGRWQDCLNRLLDSGSIFFNGIYYDTFSEHYQDMLELYDLIVGLIQPEGIFSFFNGLGADRPICYDVYKRIVELDLANYGLKCGYSTIPLSNIPSWKNVKRPYFNCNYYYHPQICFQ
ncbi:protein-arginine N5-methyltransferase Ecym_2800 [Eremothecium cymbalariae DBVPG|uniref:Arginine N-methyltransferase 2 n=1 Tax=Eremothecium cymbalariae (strain CBS 270.75 / DBVPG 7215 / KCTC 17166 / NRRL Y-17582) TaxID=931890 RepID=G8JQD4_ERECY|nr:Hypothetical protein Ecym_2800 [Eremothecium cymbalariae DBVPG\